MPLKINLKPHEKIIINGAVIQNGAHGRDFVVLNYAQVLREADVMQEAEADTPAKRTYFACQLMLMDPGQKERYWPVFERYLTELQEALINPEMKDYMSQAREKAEADNFYMAMRIIEKVIAYEAVLLGQNRP